MIITLNQLELAFLSLQINKMAKSIKKGLKRSYDKGEAKERIELLNSIRETVNSQIETNQVENILELSKEQIHFLDTFLHWYEAKLKEEYSREKKTKAFKKLKENDFESFIEELKNIQANIEEVILKEQTA